MAFKLETVTSVRPDNLALRLPCARYFFSRGKVALAFRISAVSYESQEPHGTFCMTSNLKERPV